MKDDVMRSPLILAMLLAVSTASHAQTVPQATTEGLGGSPVPGVCLLSRQAVYANAKVGQAALTRLREIANAAQQEVDTERAPVEADLTKYNADQAKLNEAQRQERQKALTDRMTPIDAKAALRQREIEATREKAMQRIATDVQPILAQVYKQHNCGLLVDRSSVLGGNMSNDLTQDVVKALDAKVSTITFERETLAANTTAPAAARR
jgi:Skp family chaperone for outer membrane proteins